MEKASATEIDLRVSCPSQSSDEMMARSYVATVESIAAKASDSRFKKSPLVYGCTMSDYTNFVFIKLLIFAKIGHLRPKPSGA